MLLVTFSINMELGKNCLMVFNCSQVEQRQSKANIQHTQLTGNSVVYRFIWKYLQLTFTSSELDTTVFLIFVLLLYSQWPDFYIKWYIGTRVPTPNYLNVEFMQGKKGFLFPKEKTQQKHLQPTTQRLNLPPCHRKNPV